MHRFPRNTKILHGITCPSPTSNFTKIGQEVWALLGDVHCRPTVQYSRQVPDNPYAATQISLSPINGSVADTRSQKDARSGVGVLLPFVKND
jgi:hypothetical protein